MQAVENYFIFRYIKRNLNQGVDVYFILTVCII
jgi:hypothetical protein